jgi:ribosomal protein L11 methyltransferase
VDWLEFSVVADGEAAEAVAELFNRYGRGGAVVETSIDCFEHELTRAPTPSSVTVKTYLPLDESTKVHRQRLEEGLWHLGRIVPIPEPVVRELPEEDWANAWKQHYRPLRIGRKIQIVPAWQAADPVPGRVVIRLEPGMAFGTGLHPTTRLCLEALENLLASGLGRASAHSSRAMSRAKRGEQHGRSNVLDVGTGCGVLAIAAAKLGARSVLALDADPVAVAVARENMVSNGVSDVVAVQFGTLPGGDRSSGAGGAMLPVLQDTGPYSLVMINILAPVIIRMAPALATRIAPGGRLIVAGLIEAQEADVERALLEQGLQIAGRAQEKDWVALVARRGTSEHVPSAGAGSGP